MRRELITKHGLAMPRLGLGTWRMAGAECQAAAAMATLVALREGGKTWTIGGTNFPTALLRRVIDELHAPIACCQFEYHAMLRQPALRAFLRGHDLSFIACSPLAKGAVAWLLDQPDVAAIPRSVRTERQRENLGALPVGLDAEDRAGIAALS